MPLETSTARFDDANMATNETGKKREKRLKK